MTLDALGEWLDMRASDLASAGIVVNRFLEISGTLNDSVHIQLTVFDAEGTAQCWRSGGCDIQFVNFKTDETVDVMSYEFETNDELFAALDHLMIRLRDAAIPAGTQKQGLRVRS
jgi:hypothetical protein